MIEYFAQHHRSLAVLAQGASTLAALALLVAIFVPLEHVFSVRREKVFYAGWSTNFAWYFVNALTPIVLLTGPSALIAAAVHAILPTSFTEAAADLPLWARMTGAMVVGEVGFYWGHRLSHEIPLLWRFHAVHHSAEHISFLVNARAHPIDMVFTRLCGLTLLYASGLASPVGPHPTLIPAVILFVGSMWSFFVHANVKWRLGPVEEILSSPFFHHWHHTRSDHKDRNYASMLPIMDRVFGTHYAPDTWPEAYGTDTPMPNGVTSQMLAPFSGRATMSAPVFPPPRTGR